MTETAVIPVPSFDRVVRELGLESSDISHFLPEYVSMEDDPAMVQAWRDGTSHPSSEVVESLARITGSTVEKLTAEVEESFEDLLQRVIREERDGTFPPKKKQRGLMLSGLDDILDRKIMVNINEMQRQLNIASISPYRRGICGVKGLDKAQKIADFCDVDISELISYEDLKNYHHSENVLGKSSKGKRNTINHNKAVEVRNQRTLESVVNALERICNYDRDKESVTAEGTTLLEDSEGIIQRGRSIWVEEGYHLSIIQCYELYKQRGYRGFKKYLTDFLGISYAYGSRKIKSYEIVKYLFNHGYSVPIGYNCLYPLVPVQDYEVIAAVWQSATDEFGQFPNRSQVQQCYNQYYGLLEKNTPDTNKNNNLKSLEITLTQHYESLLTEEKKQNKRSEDQIEQLNNELQEEKKQKEYYRKRNIELERQLEEFRDKNNRNVLRKILG